jgi:hypothetical protein
LDVSLSEKKEDPVPNDLPTSVQELVRNLAKFGPENPLTLDQVPGVENEEQRTMYAALANQLYDKLDGPAEERARSARGQLASALWQRVTEWDERAEDA